MSTAINAEFSRISEEEEIIVNKKSFVQTVKDFYVSKLKSKPWFNNTLSILKDISLMVLCEGGMRYSVFRISKLTANSFFFSHSLLVVFNTLCLIAFVILAIRLTMKIVNVVIKEKNLE